MSKHAAFIVPHRLNFGPGFGGTASRPRKKIAQTVGQGKTGAIGKIHLGKGGKESLIAHVFECLDFCQCLADQLFQKGESALIQTLINRFGRYLQAIVQLRYLRRQLCERGVGLTPDAEGHYGQKDFARDFRGCV